VRATSLSAAGRVIIAGRALAHLNTHLFSGEPMHRFRVSPAVLVLTCLTLAGCPSSTTPSNVPIEDLGARYGATFCGLLTDCYGEVARNTLLGVSSEEECASRVSLQYSELSLPLYQQAIADGTMSYDGGHVDACIAAIEAQGCDVINSRTPSACDAVLIGELSPGDACSINEQCEGDAYCMNDASCPGTCQPRGAVGTACTTDEACQSGMKCMNESCGVPAGENAPCGGPGGIDCGGGLICVGSGAEPGNCRTPATVQSGALHGACNVQMTQLCQPGLSCVVASATSMTCEMGGIAIGADCQLAVPDMCADGAFCDGTNIATGDLTGTCAALPTSGMACASVVFGGSCAAGLHCDSGTCRETHEAGGACTSGGDCYSANCVSGSCAPAMLCE
jgi:hypothetical protein